MPDLHPLQQTIIQLTDRAKSRFEGDSSGHDWLHVQRVIDTSAIIASQEGANKELTHLIALLHDVEDHKLSKPEEKGIVEKWLQEEGLGKKLIERILAAIDEISFKGANVDTPTTTLEAACVQDADRLDAIGAIGIARTFAYGGHKGQPMYEPGYNPTLHSDFESYKSHKGNTIGHFYEKLLLLKDRVQTKTARQLAEERHAYMLGFLDQWSRELGV